MASLLADARSKSQFSAKWHKISALLAKFKPTFPMRTRMTGWQILICFCLILSVQFLTWFLTSKPSSSLCKRHRQYSQMIAEQNKHPEEAVRPYPSKNCIIPRLVSHLPLSQQDEGDMLPQCQKLQGGVRFEMDRFGRLHRLGYLSEIANNLECLYQPLAIKLITSMSSYRIFNLVRGKPLVESRSLKSVFSTNPKENSAFNLLVLGLEGVSEVQFEQKFSSTCEYLVNTMNATNFLGYNIMADYKLENLLPLFTGLSRDDNIKIKYSVKSKCENHSSPASAQCPWIWTQFTNAGYRIGFNSDDLQNSPFDEVIQFSEMEHLVDYKIRSFIHQDDKDVPGGKYCLKLEALNDLLTSTVSFASMFSTKPYWYMGWSSTLTSADKQTVKAADEKLLHAIRTLHVEGLLENTILVLMSDMGEVPSPDDQSRQAHWEKMLPSFIVALPKKFRQQFPLASKNFAMNSADKFGTSYDFYAAMQDLLNLAGLHDHQVQKRSRALTSTSKSISFFLPIPSSRTCDTCGIESSNCACITPTAKSFVDYHVLNAVDHAMSQITDLIYEVPQCEPVSLNRLVGAGSLDLPGAGNYEIARTASSKTANGTKYIIRIQTHPENRTLEAQVSMRNGKYMLLDVKRLEGDDVATCVEEELLQQICECVK